MDVERPHKTDDVRESTDSPALRIPPSLAKDSRDHRVPSRDHREPAHAPRRRRLLDQRGHTTLALPLCRANPRVIDRRPRAIPERTTSESSSRAVVHYWIPRAKRNNRPSLSVVSNLGSLATGGAESAARPGIAEAGRAQDVGAAMTRTGTDGALIPSREAGELGRTAGAVVREHEREPDLALGVSILEQREPFLSLRPSAHRGLTSPPSRATLLCRGLLPPGLLKCPCGSTQHRRNMPRAHPRLAHRSFSGR
jgi:hypothetical protein